MSSVSLLGNSTINYDGTNFTINNDSTTYTGPLTIETSLEEQITVLLNFTAPIATNTDYIIININNVIFDGQNSTITVDTTDYPGLFVYNTVVNLDTVTIQNISINATNSATITFGGGWICSYGFTNTTVNNCSSNGSISSFGGGIIGAYAYNCIVNNSYSTGNMVSGGEFGGGGIFGAVCNSGGTDCNCYANNCYFANTIIDSCGGIFGPGCNYQATNSNCYANNCYSTGDIMGAGGGIFGMYCNIEANSCNCYAENCYSIGNIGNITEPYGGAGGIYGYQSQNCYANNCSSYGNICGNELNSNGGIYGDGIVNSFANNCFSIGNIGFGCGGIFLNGEYCIATNCYSFGDIGVTGGGIFASSSDCLAQNCYSTGNIGDMAGGIFGSSQTGQTLYSADSDAFSCYSLGTLATANSGGIFGYQSIVCTVNNCYVLGSSLFGYNPTNPTTDSYSYIENSNWNDNNALAVFNNNNDSNWVVTSSIKLDIS